MKLLKCIGFSVLITVFIANIFIVVAFMEDFISYNAIRELTEYSKSTGDEVAVLNDIGKNTDILWNDIENQNYNYPVPEVTTHLLIGLLISEIIGIILGSILVGVILGTIAYIFAEKKYTGKALFLSLLFALSIISIIVSLIIFGYNCLISHIVNEEINGNHILQTLDYSIVIFAITVFAICTIIIYICNFIQQKITAKKLNKELNNK